MPALLARALGYSWPRLLRDWRYAKPPAQPMRAFGSMGRRTEAGLRVPPCQRPGVSWDPAQLHARGRRRPRLCVGVASGGKVLWRLSELLPVPDAGGGKPWSADLGRIHGTGSCSSSLIGSLVLCGFHAAGACVPFRDQGRAATVDIAETWSFPDERPLPVAVEVQAQGSNQTAG